MSTTPGSEFQPLRFRDDTTLRWSCRRGEYVLQVRCKNILAWNAPSAWTILDYWQMSDGDSILLTNRSVDLPSWFELHPSEVTGTAAWEMTKRLDAGYEPRELMDGPNLWRVKSGDRLVWVKATRPLYAIEALVVFESCALVLGENAVPSLESGIVFGAPLDSPPPEHVVASRAAFDAAVAMGAARTFAPVWKFGA